jgi:hypothetical protein
MKIFLTQNMRCTLLHRHVKCHLLMERIAFKMAVYWHQPEMRCSCKIANEARSFRTFLNFLLRQTSLHTHTHPMNTEGRGKSAQHAM